MAESAFVAYGLRIGIRIDRAGLGDEILAGVMPRGARATHFGPVRRLYSIVTGDGPGWRIDTCRADAYADAGALARDRPLPEIIRALATNVRVFVASHATNRVFVHAGAVGWMGHAIVVPGRSFTGKSRLVAALVAAGATYMSDEYAVLDGHGLVHPFFKPISVRDERHRDVDLHPQDLGTVEERALPLGTIVVTRFREGADFRPRQATPGQGAVALLDHTFPVRERPAPAMAAVARATRGARVLRGVRGEADVAAAILLRRLERSGATRG